MIEQTQKATESFNAAENIIEMICLNGGQYFFDKYIDSKRSKHCSKRLIQFFSESAQVQLKSTFNIYMQFAFFPGDPGEDDQEFDENWLPEAEPVSSKFKLSLTIEQI